MNGALERTTEWNLKQDHKFSYFKSKTTAYLMGIIIIIGAFVIIEKTQLINRLVN